MLSLVFECLQLGLEYGVFLFKEACPDGNLVLALFSCVPRLLGGHVVAFAALKILAVLVLAFAERVVEVFATPLGGGCAQRGAHVHAASS